MRENSSIVCHAERSEASAGQSANIHDEDHASEASRARHRNLEIVRNLATNAFPMTRETGPSVSHFMGEDPQ